MRSLWVSVSILFLIIAYSFAVTSVMEKQIDKMEDSLSVLEETACENAEGETERLEEIFYRFRGLFTLSIPMEDVDSVEGALILLRDAQKAKSSQAYHFALSTLRFALYRMRDSAVPSWETVF